MPRKIDFLGFAPCFQECNQKQVSLDLFHNLYFPRKRRQQRIVCSRFCCCLPSPTFGIGYGTGLLCAGKDAPSARIQKNKNLQIAWVTPPTPTKFLHTHRFRGLHSRVCIDKRRRNGYDGAIDTVPRYTPVVFTANFVSLW